MKEFLKRNYQPNYHKLEKVSKKVSRLLAPNPSPFTYYGTGTYIVGSEEICIIDPGPKIESHIRNLLTQVDKNLIKYIFITHTHADHSPAAEILKKETNAKTYGFGPYPNIKTDKNFEEGHDTKFIPDFFLKDGQKIEGKDWVIKAIHTPGHTSNHMCFGLEEDKILFTGDHVMGWATTVVVPPDGDMGEYVQSLKKIQKLNYKKYLPTHGASINNPSQFIRALIAHRKMREHQILNELSINNINLEKMVEKFYANTDKKLWKAAEKSLLATLLSLEKKGLVSKEKNNKLAAYNWKLEKNK